MPIQVWGCRPTVWPSILVMSLFLILVPFCFHVHLLKITPVPELGTLVPQTGTRVNTSWYVQKKSIRRQKKKLTTSDLFPILGTWQSIKLEPSNVFEYWSERVIYSSTKIFPSSVWNLGWTGLRPLDVPEELPLPVRSVGQPILSRWKRSCP